MPTLEKLLTLREAGEVLGLRYDATRELIATGALPVVRLAGKTMRIRPRDLARFVERGGLDHAPKARRVKVAAARRAS